MTIQGERSRQKRACCTHMYVLVCAREIPVLLVPPLYLVLRFWKNDLSSLSLGAAEEALTLRTYATINTHSVHAMMMYSPDSCFRSGGGNRGGGGGRHIIVEWGGGSWGRRLDR